jgi:chromatin structure-remodeling complex subunit RSC4
VTKESDRLAGVPAGEDADEAEANGDAGSEDEGKKKKAPSMNRLLKTRLQKLVDKTDDE